MKCFIIVERRTVGGLIEDAALVTPEELQRYVSDEVGAATLRDIVGELEKPGRDPRQSFEPPEFRNDVNQVSDLREGMALEGVVTASAFLQASGWLGVVLLISTS